MKVIELIQANPKPRITTRLINFKNEACSELLQKNITEVTQEDITKLNEIQRMGGKSVTYLKSLLSKENKGIEALSETEEKETMKTKADTKKTVPVQTHVTNVKVFDANILKARKNFDTAKEQFVKAKAQMTKAQVQLFNVEKDSMSQLLKAM